MTSLQQRKQRHNNMLLSIKTFLAIIIIIVGVVSATIAFVPLFFSAMESVEEVVTVLRGEVSSRIQGTVTDFFTVCQQNVASLMLAGTLGAMSDQAPMTMAPWLGSMSHALGKLNFYVGLQDGRFVSATVNNFPNMSFSYTGQFNVSLGLTNDTSFRMTYNLHNRSNVTPIAQVVNRYDPTKRPWYNPLYAAQSWSSVYLDNSGLYSVLTGGGPFVNGSGVKVGAIGVDFPTTNVITYLRTQRVGLSGRVLLIDRLTRGFLGGNWNVSGVVNVTGSPLRMAFLADIAPSDPLVARVAAEIGESQLLACTAPCRFDLHDGAPVNSLYVDVVSVSDAYGLDMRLVQLIPAKDYLSKVDKDSKTSIGATAGAVIGLLLIAVAVGQVALQPLTVLEEKIQLASTLSDEVVEDAPINFLSEIVLIEESFNNLQAELKRVKSFVPQSVLQRLEEGEDGEGDLTSDAASSIADSRRDSSAVKVARRHSRAADGRSLASSGGSVARSTRAGRQMHGLNLASGLATRQVTMAMINLVGFHDVAGTKGPSACETLHTEYLRIIEAACTEFKGVFDSFSGDHVVVSFNASNSVPSHLTRCAAMICAIEQAVHKRNVSKPQLPPMGVRIAAATGRCLVGNVGTDKIKRFTIIGSIVNQCSVLLQLAKMWKVSNVVSVAAMDVMELEYQIQPVGVAQLPLSSISGNEVTAVGVPFTPVGTIVAAKKANDDEWMYQLNAGSNVDDENKALRNAFTLLAQRNRPGSNNEELVRHAREILETKIRSTSLPGAVRLIAELGATPNPLGSFYDSVCGTSSQ